MKVGDIVTDRAHSNIGIIIKATIQLDWHIVKWIGESPQMTSGLEYADPRDILINAHELSKIQYEYDIETW